MRAGAFAPEPVLENPALVEQLRRDFAHAGSDVIEASPYYGHREKLRVIGRKKADTKRLTDKKAERQLTPVPISVRSKKYRHVIDAIDRNGGAGIRDQG